MNAQSSAAATASNTMPNGEYRMNKRWGAIAMLISATGMGMVGFFSRGALEGIGGEYKAPIGSFLASGRMTVGLIGFIILLFALKKVELFKKTKLSPAIIFGGVCIGLSLGFYISSTLMTSIANAVFLIYTGPLFCTLLASIFRKEKIHLFQGVFLFLVFIGMLLTINIVQYTPADGLTIGIDLSASTPEFPRKALGDAFGLLSGVFYGLALFFNGYRKDVDSIVRGVWNFFWALVATVCMIAVFALAGMAPRPDLFTPTNWLWAAGLFVFSGLVALGFLVIAGRNLPAVEYSTISYWECVVAILFGLLFFHEAMSFTAGLGGALIMIGGLAPIFIHAKDPVPETNNK